MIYISSLSGAISVHVDEVYEWLFCGTSAARCAAGPGTLAAGFAALGSYIGQVATAEPPESLAETKRQAVTMTNCSCERKREIERDRSGAVKYGPKKERNCRHNLQSLLCRLF